MATQENAAPQGGNNGESVKGIGRELAVEQKIDKQENLSQTKTEKEKHPLVALLEVILSLMGVTQEEKAHVKADPTIQKGASVQTIEASAARVAPERSSAIAGLPETELAKIAQEKNVLMGSKAEMQKETPTHIAYNGGKSPQQQATSHTV